jgi:NTP pyrophosphatase (non-canonical NTP hydrolase)
MLRAAFRRQQEFMDMLVEHDVLPEYPVDIRTKMGQRLVRENVFNVVDELCEAVATLKNKVHRLTDDQQIDVAHYREELGDAFAYFMEVCILSGIFAEDLYAEFCRKNAIVKQRLREGY